MGNTVTVIVKAKDEASKKLDGITKLSLGLTAGFAAVGVASIKMAMDFERGLDQVQAVTGATGKEMEGLSAKAKQIGADTAFSASQAVTAMEALGTGGVKTADIMGGAADAVVALAAAGGTDLTTAANVAATAMDVWGISASDLTGIVNNVAGVANVSKFGVEDMSLAMAQGGTVAALAGVSFDDFAASIAATSSAFSSGSDAGTSFKTFITALANPTDKAKKAMDEIGFSAYDASGNLKSMAEITQNLHDSLGPLSEQQRSQAAATIFGSDAMRTALSLSQQTATEFTKLSETMKSTDAASVAAVRMGNLSGDIEALKGSVETLGISIGSKAIPALAGLAKGGTEAVNAFAELPAGTQNLALMGAAAVAAGPAIVTLGEKSIGVFKKMGGEAATTQGKVAGLAIGLTALAVGADLILSKTTGDGLITHLMGDADDNERARKAATETAAVLAGIGQGGIASEIEKTATAWANVTKELEAAKRAGPGGAGMMVELTGNAKQLEANIGALGAAMQAGGATLKEQHDLYSKLNPDLQEAFNKTTQVEAAWAKYEDAILSSIPTMQQMHEEQRAFVESNKAVADVVPVAVSEIDKWTAGVAEAKDGTKDFAQALEDLTNQFATANPTVIALNAQHALLSEELADLKDKGDAATASDKARIQVIEGELLPAIDKEIKVYADNQAAMEGMQGAAEKMIGPAGYGALLDVMARLKVPQEDQIALTGKIATAYQNLTKGDIPAAIAGFGEMKKELSPEVWGPIGEAVGPALGAAIKNSLTGPAKDEAVAAATGLGIAIGEGVAQGLGSASNRIVATGRGLVRGLIEEMAAEAVVESPSKETEYIGAMMGDGLRVGLLSREVEIYQTAERIAANTVGIMQAAVPTVDANGNWGSLPPWAGGSTIPHNNDPHIGDMQNGLTYGYSWNPVQGAWQLGWDANALLTNPGGAPANNADFPVRGSGGGNGFAAGGGVPPITIHLTVDGQTLATVVHNQNALAY